MNHLYDCTHDPCRCPTAHDLLRVFTDDELVDECRVRGLDAALTAMAVQA